MRVKARIVTLRVEMDLWRAIDDVARVFYGDNFSMAMREVMREGLKSRFNVSEHPTLADLQEQRRAGKRE